MSTLKPGTRVICSYRLPTPHQFWAHGPAWVGEVLEPGDDLAAWNGHNSERTYCQRTGHVPVRYSFGVLHDRADALMPIHAAGDFIMPASEFEAQSLADLFKPAEPEVCAGRSHCQTAA
jgi:hypothetical protein